MSNNNSQFVSVRILNSEYRVKCPPEKLADLEASSQYLDEKMREIKEKSGVMSVDRIAIIAALNIAGERISLGDELLKEKQNNLLLSNTSNTLQTRLKNLIARIQGALGSDKK